MEWLTFHMHVYSKRQRRQLSILLRRYQFRAARILVNISPIPEMTGEMLHHYHEYDPESTLREDILRSVDLLRKDGYSMSVVVKVQT